MAGYVSTATKVKKIVDTFFQPFVLILLFLPLLPVNTIATPLKLEYQISDHADRFSGYDSYLYNFKLTLDNNDESWAPGQGFGWLVFGDAPVINISRLSDFRLNGGVSDNSPWQTIGLTIGSHNGPTFQYVLDYWFPNELGESIYWSGLSQSYLGAGQLLFSTVSGTADIVRANFETAYLVHPVPEPSTVIFTLWGLVIVAMVKRRLTWI